MDYVPKVAKDLTEFVDALNESEDGFMDLKLKQRLYKKNQNNEYWFFLLELMPLIIMLTIVALIIFGVSTIAGGGGVYFLWPVGIFVSGSSLIAWLTNKRLNKLAEVHKKDRRSALAFLRENPQLVGYVNIYDKLVAAESDAMDRADFDDRLSVIEGRYRRAVGKIESNKAIAYRESVNREIKWPVLPVLAEDADVPPVRQGVQDKVAKLSE